MGEEERGAHVETNVNQEHWDTFMEEVNVLINKNDPESNPFCSKYEALSLLNKKKHEILVQNQDTKTKSNFDDLGPDSKVMISRITLSMGSLNIQTEDTPKGEKQLMKFLMFFDSLDSGLKSILLKEQMDSLNQLGVLWSQRGELEKSRQFLERSEQVYLSSRKCGDSERFDCGNGEMESLYTYTLFYLAQVYSNLDRKDLSAQYCKSTLERQLTQLLPLSFDSVQVDADPDWNAYRRSFDDLIRWVESSVQLSVYYLNESNWSHCFQCLKACDLLLEKTDKFRGHGGNGSVEGEFIESSSPDDSDEDLRYAIASVHLGWAKLHLAILQDASEMYLSSTEKGINEEEIKGTVLPIRLDFFPLFSLDLPHPSQLFLVLGPSKITNFEARDVFNAGIRLFKKAKDYYVLEGHVTEHVEILQDMCSLYNFLLRFEKSPRRIAAMFRKRVALLDPIVEQLNPQHFADLLKQLHFQMGEMTHQLLFAEVGIITSEETKKGITQQDVGKISHLVTKTVLFFEQFLKSFQVNGKDPGKIEGPNEEAYMYAHFWIARAHSALLTPGNKKAELSSIQKSLREYKWLVEYTDNYHPPFLKQEIPLCREMLDLLPFKVKQILQGL